MTIRLGKNRYSKDNSYNQKQPQVPLDPARFAGLLAEYGIRLKHEKVSLCPNFAGNSDSNAHIIGCPLCKDSNFVEFDPQEIWGFFQQDILVKNFFSQGWWDRGTAMLTVPTYSDTEKQRPIYIHYFHRITLLDFEEPFYELLTKSDGDTDTMRFEATQLLFVRTASTIFRVGHDCDLTPSGNLRWLGANRPKYDLQQEFGETISVAYLRRPVYRVLEMMHEGRYSQFHFKQKDRSTARFPQQCLIKKDFLMARPDTDRFKTVIDSQTGAQQPGGFAVPNT